MEAILLCLCDIYVRLFSFIISISSIYYLRGTPLVSDRSITLLRPIMPNRTNTVIGLMPLLWRQPRQMGLEVEARVPMAETTPEPIPRALDGYSSQKQIWKKQKQKATEALKIKTMMISRIASILISLYSGFWMKLSSSEQKAQLDMRINPHFLLQMLSIKKYEGIKVTSSDKLTTILLTQMLNPMLSMMSAGPQYIAYTINEIMLEHMVMILKLGNRHRSIGVNNFPQKFQVICSAITCSTSSLVRTLSIPRFILPILFMILTVCSGPFLTKNCGVSKQEKYIKARPKADGPMMRISHMTLQLFMKQKKPVMIMAPTGNHICTNTEYFCRFQSPTTSPKKKKAILMHTSAPNPHIKRPTDAMQILTLDATTTAPKVSIPQPRSSDVLRPQLSAKKEITRQPRKAPKQVKLLSMSTKA